MQSLSVRLVSHNNSQGGAALAFNALHQEFLALGHDSQLLVGVKTEDGNGVHQLPTQTFLTGLRDRLGVPSARRRIERLFRNRVDANATFDLFTSPYSEFSATAAALSHRADILQLNWVARLIDWRRFFAAVSDCPIFWRLADMSPFTGGCHFSGTCRQFAHRCARCPQMNLEQRCRETALTWEVKERALRAVPDEQLTFVLQSQWMADQLRQSPIAGRFSTVKISNGVDRSVFFSGNVLEERNALGIADDRPLLIVCAGSMTQRKGLSQLLDELEARRNRPEFELLWVGRQPTRIPQGIRFHAFPSPSRNRLREFYSASDLLLFPSLQDNCPNTVIESLASGTPAIVFGGSGTEELIEPGIDGEVVDELDFGVFVDKLFELIADRKLLGNLKDMTVARTPHRRTIREVAVDYVQAYRSRLAAR